ncbi:hypothetical protein [Cellulomonas persica]
MSAHRRAVAALAQSESDMAGARGERFELLARGGQPVRALRALAADSHLLVAADTPADRFAFLRHVVAGTAALQVSHADEPVAFAGVPATDVATLHAWALAQADELARAFDARNGTDRFALLLAAARATRPADVVLDLDVIPAGFVAQPAAASHGSAGTPLPDGPVTQGAGPSHAGSGPAGAGAAEPHEPPAARAERLAREGDLVGAARAWLAAAAVAESEGRLGDAGLATAEAARCAQELGDDDGAAAVYPRAVARMRAGGVPPQDVVPVVVAWSPVAVTTGTADAALAAVDGLLHELADDPSTTPGAPAPDPSAAAAGAALTERVASIRRRACADLDDTAARVLASLGPEHADVAAARATRAAEAYAAGGAVADAAHAFWLAGRLHDSQGRVDDAVWNLESAVEGFGVVRQRGPRGEAASALVAVLRAAGRDERAEELLRLLSR